METAIQHLGYLGLVMLVYDGKFLFCRLSNLLTEMKGGFSTSIKS